MVVEFNGDVMSLDVEVSPLAIKSNLYIVENLFDQSFLLPDTTTLGIADTMAVLQKEGRPFYGEHNILGEAFLVMASSSGIQQQLEV
ncbi:hypothetical protein CQW23_29744 [Capsicum baccatum]|uniref:Exportin-5 C-terminal domain-containing protein n=1 Tax=Capsicum baccatum TaxID=33114 RepID=A0A2G2VCG9_CAPBA|nr:hypothetical protein CQW23_29744 [Capsicum baccatum]